MLERYCLAAALLVSLPVLGIVIGGSTASFALNVLGRENGDARSLRLSRALIGTAAGNHRALFIAGLLPLPLVAYFWQRILAGQTPLPWLAWIIPFGAFLSGCALLSLYRSAVLRGTDLSGRPFQAAAAGLLAMLSAASLLFFMLGALADPANLPLIRSHAVYILSWNSLVAFFLFLALSFGLTGGIVLHLAGRAPKGAEGPDSGDAGYVRSVGAALAVAAALALPVLVVLDLVSLPVTGLSTEVFVMAATVIVLALGVVVLLTLIPEKRNGAPGARVSALFVLMFVAVLLGDQAAIGNAFEGRTAPPGPLAAEKVSKEGKPGGKPAAGAAAAEKGKTVFERICSACHKFDARVVGPPLNGVVPKYKGNVDKLKSFIRNPVKVDPGYPAMPKPAIKEEEIDAVARYLLSTVKGGK